MGQMVTGVLFKTKVGGKYAYYENDGICKVYYNPTGSKKAKITTLRSRYELFEKKYRSVNDRMKQNNRNLGNR